MNRDENDREKNIQATRKRKQTDTMVKVKEEKLSQRHSIEQFVCTIYVS